ncbi:MAG: hypothetical protein ACJ749_06935, partial [Flavisolibacter sp.]
MKTATLLVILIICLPGYGQDSTRARSSFIGLDVAGVPVQRISGTDTSFENALSVSPVIDLRTQGGWGISYSPSFVHSARNTGLYMHSFSAGYEQYDKHNMDLVFNYTHFIFTDKT